MATYERIVNKLTNYLVSLGFKEKNGQYTKVLKDTADFRISKTLYDAISTGKAYGGNMDYLPMCAEENFITDLENGFDKVLPLTDHEKEWLQSFDEDGLYGWDLISEWIWDNVEVTVQKKAFNAFTKTLAA